MADTKAPNYDEDATKKSSTNMDPKVANLLAYLFSWLGGLIIWLMEKENKFVKWNALQAMILGIAEMAVVIIFFWIFSPIFMFSGLWMVGTAFSTIGGILIAVAYVLAIICIIMGFQGKTFRIPGIAKLADKYFKM
jgi:uncharacterized membrane protein